MTNYDFVKKFASLIHYKQAYGPYPYTYHLELVEETLRKFGFDDEALILSAHLHDSIEDANVSYEMIKFGFGEEVAEIVYAITNEQGRTRRERYEKTYIKIKANYKATILKLADRIVNIEFSQDTNSNFKTMYQGEWPEFKKALYEKDKDERVNNLWKHLENLLEKGETNE